MNFAELVVVLDQKKLLPKNILHSEFENIHIYNVFDERKISLIENDVQVGFSENEEIAFSKALSEYFERKAYREYVRKNDPSSLKNGSDGFAAYPMLLEAGRVKKIARENAFCEALERYVWANWWDNISSQTKIKTSTKFFEKIVSKIGEMINIENVQIICPAFSQYEKYEVVIIFLKIKNKGYITGGAAGLKSNIDGIIERASSELLRHALAVCRSEAERIEPNTFYEKRLISFSSGRYNNLVMTRLDSKSTQQVVVPELEYDEEIVHSIQEYYYIHRCLFYKQPPFVKGDLLRLCL